MDTDFEVASITVEAFINDAEARNSSEAWYFQSNLVYLDPAHPTEPYVLIKGQMVDVPPGSTLTDW